MAQVPNKIVLKSSTKMSLNERFTHIQKQPRSPPAQNIRAKMAAQQQASVQNRRLAQQMANRPSVQAALKVPQKSQNLKQRLGKSNIKARLNLPFVPRGRGRGVVITTGRGRGRGRLGRGRGGGSQLNLTHTGATINRGGAAVRRGFRGRGRGGVQRGRGGTVRGGTVRGRGTFQNRGRGQRDTGFGRPWRSRGRRGGGRGRGDWAGNPSPFRGTQRGRGRFMRGRGRGARGGRGRGAGANQQPDRETLDNQLEAYMSKTKSHLDAELDAYMTQAEQS